MTEPLFPPEWSKEISKLKERVFDLERKLHPVPPTGGRRGNVHRAATWVVAAFDSTDEGRGAADFVCFGSNDHSVVQQAIDLLPNGRGRVLLLEGHYNFSG